MNAIEKISRETQPYQKSRKHGCYEDHILIRWERNAQEVLLMQI